MKSLPYIFPSFSIIRKYTKVIETITTIIKQITTIITTMTSVVGLMHQKDSESFQKTCSTWNSEQHVYWKGCLWTGVGWGETQIKVKPIPSECKIRFPDNVGPPPFVHPWSEFPIPACHRRILSVTKVSGLFVVPMFSRLKNKNYK